MRREASLTTKTLGWYDFPQHNETGNDSTPAPYYYNFNAILDSHSFREDIFEILFELRPYLEMGIADFLFEHKTPKEYLA